MGQIITEMQFFLKQKKLYILLGLTAIGSYGFMITHPTIGIDDTVIPQYFEDGLAPVIGRWVIFAANKVFRLSDVTPIITDLLGVIFMCLAAVMFCVAVRRLLGDRLSLWPYIIFCCVFVSSPITSEVYTYFLHNGLGFGFLATAFALLQFQEGRMADKKIKPFLLSACSLTIAIGCYESMMFVFVIAVIGQFLLIQLIGLGKQKEAKVIGWAAGGILTLIVSMLLRQFIIWLLVLLFGLQDQIGILKIREFSEVLGWFNGNYSISQIAMLFKRFFLLYYVNAFLYYPIKIYVFAIFLIFALSLVLGILKKNFWVILSAAGIILVPWIMILLEGETTYYRSAQYIPITCAYAVLPAAFAIQLIPRERIRSICRLAGALLAAVIIYNQTTEMNKWFYVDYMKYEDAVTTMEYIAWELEKNYDTSKPVVFCGEHEVPISIIKDAVVLLSSEEFTPVRKITDTFDVYLKEKYYGPGGYYHFAQTPRLSVINWGMTAFNGSNNELFHFLEMHGYSFVQEKDVEILTEIREYCAGNQVPKWPKNGAIFERDGYIIVNF